VVWSSDQVVSIGSSGECPVVGVLCVVWWSVVDGHPHLDNTQAQVVGDWLRAEEDESGGLFFLFRTKIKLNSNR
jgi:hypothetical protein